MRLHLDGNRCCLASGPVASERFGIVSTALYSTPQDGACGTEHAVLSPREIASEASLLHPDAVAVGCWRAEAVERGFAARTAGKSAQSVSLPLSHSVDAVRSP